MNAIPSRDTIKTKLIALIQQKNWREALTWERILVDQHHQHYAIYDILTHVRFSEEGIAALRGEEGDGGSSLYLLGYMLWWGRGGPQHDEAEAFYCFSKAAELGHVLALHWKGCLLSESETSPRNEAAGAQCYIEAGQRGCDLASNQAGLCFEKGIGVARDLRQAALFYQMGARAYQCSADSLSRLKWEHPMEVAPFGQWRPTARCQELVPRQVHQAMKITWMIMRYRQQMPRLVCRLIVFWVCTKNGWGSFFFW